jgi:hypothetical protein
MPMKATIKTTRINRTIHMVSSPCWGRLRRDQDDQDQQDDPHGQLSLLGKPPARRHVRADGAL